MNTQEQGDIIGEFKDWTIQCEETIASLTIIEDTPEAFLLMAGTKLRNPQHQYYII